MTKVLPALMHCVPAATRPAGTVRSGHGFLTGLLAGIALVLLAVNGLAGEEGGSTCRLVETEAGYELRFNGEPYFIKGVGGKDRLDLLAECGGNSIRTWGADGIEQVLDDAHRNGLTVTVGFWLGHERHGFDYGDAEQLRRQLEMVRRGVLRHKDHPALLMWAAGNEMEADGSNIAIWDHVNEVARLIKELDEGRHPVMTVIAEVGGEKVSNLHRYCPDIDIAGLNTYGGIGSIGTRYRDAGGIKPYVVTEFGPPGQWEMAPKPWGAPEEFTSTKKAEWYVQGYRDGVLGEPGFCLGSYAFIWGHKQEATATWYGLFLRGGARLQAVEAMREAWNGGRFDNLCPRVTPITLEKDSGLVPGDRVRASWQVTDPEEDPVEVTWVLRRDSGNYTTGGDDQPDTEMFPGAVVDSSVDHATVRVPEGGGAYRIFAYARDAEGNAAVANAPFHVKGRVLPPPLARVTPPFTVYGDKGGGEPFVPSGYMGNSGAIAMNDGWSERPYDGTTCIKVEYHATNDWGGVVWQSPPNDWGDRAGGFNVSAANVLSFRARGEEGGEKVLFGVGIIGNDKAYGDSVQATLEGVSLSPAWREYRIPLSGLNLSAVKSGFYWTVHAEGEPVTFYLDRIEFLHDDRMPPAVETVAGDVGGSPRATMPFTVYEEAGGSLPWVPSGYMGNTDAIQLDLGCTENPRTGATCLRADYTDPGNWAGVVWQNPANDWGEKPGGFDLRDASALSFWVRGDEGGERVSFGFGIIEADKPYSDTTKGGPREIILTKDWKEVRIAMAESANRSRIKTGFYWTLGGQGRPVTFYLDDIRYE